MELPDQNSSSPTTAIHYDPLYRHLWMPDCEAVGRSKEKVRICTDWLLLSTNSPSSSTCLCTSQWAVLHCIALPSGCYRVWFCVCLLNISESLFYSWCHSILMRMILHGQRRGALWINSLYLVILFTLPHSHNDTACRVRTGQQCMINQEIWDEGGG